ncbi:MAG TPA: hypothetical protein VLC93_05350, partial [Myxococcota bacterium]|nr:hypothetical protein [Myxococcota bacterium]
QLDGHPNQTMNCAPATMALIERYLGPELALSDRALVATLVRVAGTDRTGTGPDGIVRMVHGLGLNGAVLGDWRHLVQHLGSVQHVVRDRGWLALAAGNGFALPWNQRPGMVGGHAIALVGLDPAGNFVVQDPGDTAPLLRTLTPLELTRFIGGIRGVNQNGGGGLYFVWR